MTRAQEIGILNGTMEQVMRDMVESMERGIQTGVQQFMEYDYTFNNTMIKGYFEKEEDSNSEFYYIPTYELIYLHTHPLIVPNFMTELSEMIIVAGKAIEKHKLSTYYTDKLTDAAIRIGKELPSINNSNAALILEAMRDAYKLCKDLSTLT